MLMTFCDFVFGLSFICCHLIISESGILDHWGEILSSFLGCFWSFHQEHDPYEWNGGKPATVLLIPDPMLMMW